MGIGDASGGFVMRCLFTAHLLANKLFMQNRVLKLPVVFLLVLMGAVWTLPAGGAYAETRTLNLYMTHTKEYLKITYKKDGRYIPSAMRKLNYFFRDWRRNAVIKMDPKTIDLLWELYADLGAQAPAHIISGYRSPKTNAMLRRIGRHVARHSQHMRGKAIDVTFPDVPIWRLRNSALVRQVGGVGYYPRSGKYGFVHIDSGSVRHWPRVPATRMAKIFRDYRKTIGARFRRKAPAAVQVAKRNSGPRDIIPVKNTKTAIAVSGAVTSKPPLPRPRPLSVLMAAVAADVTISPASAPVPVKNFGARPSVIQDDIAGLITSNNFSTQQSNTAAKGSFAAQVSKGHAENVPLIRPLYASTAGRSDFAGAFGTTPDEMVRRNGAPRPFTRGNTQLIASNPVKLTDEEKTALNNMIAALTGQSKPLAIQHSVTSGKADRLVVNRSGKSDLLLPNRKRRTISQTANPKNNKFAANLESVLHTADRPIEFNQ